MAQNRNRAIAAVQIARIKSGQRRIRIRQIIVVTFAKTILVIAGIVGIQAVFSHDWD